MEPQQYRPLGPDEIIQEGDELNVCKGIKVKGLIGQYAHNHPGALFRRPIPVAKSETVEEVPVTRKYVLGFLFRDNCTSVVLIRKNKPQWQAGLLNGIGGKIEQGETPDQSMAREFKEETGATVQTWRQFCEMSGDGFIVYCFTARDSDAWEKACTQESEPVAKVNPDDLGQQACVSNLHWLIELALDENNGNFHYGTIRYCTPFTMATFEHDLAAMKLRAEKAEAGRLECERQYQEQVAKVAVWMDKAETAERERDEARALAVKNKTESDRYLNGLMLSEKEIVEFRKEVVRLGQERDTLRAENISLRDWKEMGIKITPALEKSNTLLTGVPGDSVPEKISSLLAENARFREALESIVVLTSPNVNRGVSEFEVEVYKLAQSALAGTSQNTSAREAFLNEIFERFKSIDEVRHWTVEQLSALAGKGEKS